MISPTPFKPGAQADRSPDSKVTVVVPCRNESRHIEGMLRSVLALESPPGGFEVIVADGMSDDGTRDVLNRLAGEDPRLRVVDNRGLIVSTGLNLAIREARGDIIIRMDAHTEYARDYILRCVDVLGSSGADNVGGPWLAVGKGMVSQAIAAAFQSPFAVGGARGHQADHEGPVDTVYLGCWRRSLFDRIGFFDEELVRNQDDEFNLRLILNGGKIWQSPRIKSRYFPRESLALLFRQYLQYGYWKVRVIRKHKRPASIRHVVPGAFILMLAIMMALAPFSHMVRWGLYLTLAIYLSSVSLASLMTAARHQWSLIRFLPAIFPIFHFSYGLGFLWGIWDFIVRKKSPSTAHTAITRSQAGEKKMPI